MNMNRGLELTEGLYGRYVKFTSASYRSPDSSSTYRRAGEKLGVNAGSCVLEALVPR